MKTLILIHLSLHISKEDVIVTLVIGFSIFKVDILNIKITNE